MLFDIKAFGVVNSFSVQKLRMWNWSKTFCQHIRRYSRIQPPPPAVVRVSNNIAQLGSPKEPPKPRQLMSLPPFPGLPLPGKKSVCDHVTAISWVKYYFDEISDSVIQSHFNKDLVHVEEFPGACSDYSEKEGETNPMRKILQMCNCLLQIKDSDIMSVGARVFLPVSVAETKVSKRFDSIPSGTSCPNADEINYLQRLVKYKDSSILVLNKPPKLPVKGNLPVHNSMDALAAAALCYDYDEGPKLVHRLERESSGLLLMGRTKESGACLNWIFSDLSRAKSKCQAWNDACRTTYQQYWALVIGAPKYKEGLIRAPLSKVLLDDGKTERVILAPKSGLEASQKAVTEYRVLGPMINGCSWIELRPLTSRKHQLRVHCAEALGTPIVGDYKYGWYIHRTWKQVSQVDIEPSTGNRTGCGGQKVWIFRREVYCLKSPCYISIAICREIVLPNIEKLLHVLEHKPEGMHPALSAKPDLLRFVGSLPSHMKISWNLLFFL